MSETQPGGLLAARTLRRAGVDVVFALPGGHIHPLFRGSAAEDLRLIVTRHEENAVLMAAGHSLATGRVSVAAVTAGPGLANALPGIAEANAAGLPVVVIAGRTGLRHRGRGAVQDLDQTRLVASVTKWADTCLDTGRIPEYVAEAVHRAGSGAPGVAYLDIPQDVFNASAPEAEPAWDTGHAHPGRSAPIAEDVDKAVAMLAEADRPVILAGSGALFSQAGPALQRFIERTGIPLVTTSAARGLVDDDHPDCLGSLVHGGVALASADVSLLLGSRFNANLVYGGLPLFSPEQRVIQVDIRPEHHGGPRRPALALTGDVAATVDAFTSAWTAGRDRWESWRADADRAAGASFTAWIEETKGEASGVHPGLLIAEVARFADELGDHTFVSDGGDSVVWALAFSRAHRPGTSLSIGSAMGTLGMGLPYALGARVARPDEPVVLLTGDGAFGLSAMELDTAARHRLPVLIVVVDNGGWGDIRHEAGDTAFGPVTGFRSTMRYDLLAEAVGGHGEQVELIDELGPALGRAREAIERGVPAVIDVVVDPQVASTFMSHLSGLELM